MIKKSMIYGIPAFLLLMFMTRCSQISPKPLKTNVPPATQISELETEIPIIMKNAMIPGLSLALIRDGNLIWSRGFGIRSVETQEAVTNETLYEACSLSKPVFAYAVMKLVERGQLELDRPLIEYADDAYIEDTFQGGKIEDNRIRKITARMVLSHTPGFPNWRRQKQIQIHFEPGEKFSYSGEGFVFLQRIVEKITGQALNDFMKKEVFDPLGMKQSSYIWEKSFDNITAYPHTMIGTVQKKYKPKRGVSAASLQTTAPDFGRFIMALMNNHGLNGTTVANMLTPQVTVNPEETEKVSWGLGIGLEQSYHGTACWHWGDNENFKCFTLAFPEKKIGMVYFTNSYYGLTAARRIVEASVGGNHSVFTSNFLSNYGDLDDASMQFTRIFVKDGVNAAIETYKKLNQENPQEKIVSENTLNRIGYMLLERDQIDDAIQIFKLNVTAYPESFNVYDSLGEAYMKNGEKELAIQNYEKSIELNPDNENGKKMLEKLKET